MADSGDTSKTKNRLLFWKKTETKVSPQDAITRLRNLQDMLQKKTDYLEMKIEQETQCAMENRVKNKRAAMQALRRRKRWQKQLQALDNTIATVEVQLDAITEASVTSEVVRCLQQSNQVLQAARGNLSAEKVADLRDELQDMMDDNQEIQDLLAQPIGQDFDEEDLWAELEELEEKELTDSMCNLDLDLPSVPTHKVPDTQEMLKKKEEAEEAEEFKRLAAEFS